MAEAAPENAVEAAETAEAEAAAPDAAATALEPETTAESPSLATTGGFDPTKLSSQTRNVLKIPVVVTVSLANQRRPIHEIIEMGPGTIVKFEKTFDEPMELTVGELTVATGEVVKVGDKFGLRIGRIVSPQERAAR